MGPPWLGTTAERSATIPLWRPAIGCFAGSIQSSTLFFCARVRSCPAVCRPNPSVSAGPWVNARPSARIFRDASDHRLENRMHQILLRPLPVPSRGGKAEATMSVASGQVFDLDCPTDPTIGRFTRIREATISGANACWGHFLAALHESRRKQASIERARHRHLIYDADTGLHFGAARRQADQPRRL